MQRLPPEDDAGVAGDEPRCRAKGERHEIGRGKIAGPSIARCEIARSGRPSDAGVLRESELPGDERRKPIPPRKPRPLPNGDPAAGKAGDDWRGLMEQTIKAMEAETAGKAEDGGRFVEASPPANALRAGRSPRRRGEADSRPRRRRCRIFGRRSFTGCRCCWTPSARPTR